MTAGRVLLADDDRTFRETTRALLAAHGYECHGVADAHAVGRMLSEAAWDALVTDVAMPGSDDLAYLLRQPGEGVFPPVVVVTGFPSVGTAVRALRMSATDYLTKPLDVASLLAALRRAVARAHGVAGPTSVHEGPGKPAPNASPDPSPAPPGAADLGVLSARQREIVIALQNGYRPPEIAEALSLSVRTVRNHLHSIYRKLGVGSQVELLSELRYAEGSDG